MCKVTSEYYSDKVDSDHIIYKDHSEIDDDKIEFECPFNKEKNGFCKLHKNDDLVTQQEFNRVVQSHDKLLFVDLDLSQVNMNNSLQSDTEIVDCNLSNKIHPKSININIHDSYISLNIKNCEKISLLGCHIYDLNIDDKLKKIELIDGKVNLNEFPTQIDKANHDFEVRANTEFIKQIQFKTFKEHPDFTGSIFKKDADFSDLEFIEGAIFRDTEFKQNADFENTTFKDELIFTSVTVKRNSNFIDTRFENGAKFCAESIFNDVEFSGSRFNGEANFNKAKFNGETKFNSCTFEERPKFEEMVVKGCIYFGGRKQKVKFKEGVNFVGTEFKNSDGKSSIGKSLIFKGSSFFGNVNFNETILEQPIIFSKISFLGNTEFTFKDSIFKEQPYFKHISDDNMIIDFKKSTFMCEFDMSEQGEKIHDLVHAKVKFEKTIFEESAKIKKKTSVDFPTFEDAEFGKIAVFETLNFTNDTEFKKARFKKDVTFENIKFKEVSNFTAAVFESRAHFPESDLSEMDLRGINLTGSDLRGCDLRKCNLYTVDLKDCIIDSRTEFFTQIRSTNIFTIDKLTHSISHHQKSYRDIKEELLLGEDERNIEETINEGPPEFKEFIRTRRNTKIEKLQKIKKLYTQIETSARENSIEKTQQIAFINKKDIIKTIYLLKLKSSVSSLVTFYKNLGKEDVINLYKFTTLELQRKIFNYGESSGKLLGWSILMIFIFSLIYTSMRRKPLPNVSLNSIFPDIVSLLSYYYSALLYSISIFFTGSGRDIITPTKSVSNLVITIESILGVLFIALLIFTITRSVSR